ncbi:MAG TPA: PPOX class F420-dependent oxidoreductase [Gaiellaceae bacterium]|nr:PPOX class F420-dependent oxidoreductase [Gaiellaceae bacterium]
MTQSQLDFLDEPYFGIVTTLRADGSPQSTMVWVERDVDTVSFNTAYGRAKPSNLERDPRVSVLVSSPDFYHWIAVDGRAELTTDGAEEQIDRLSRKYDGKPWEYVDGQRRVKVRVVPEHVTAYGLD